MFVLILYLYGTCRIGREIHLRYKVISLRVHLQTRETHLQ